MNNATLHTAVYEKLYSDIPLVASSLHERLEAAKHLGILASAIAEISSLGFLFADLRNLFIRISEVSESHLHEALPKTYVQHKGYNVVSKHQLGHDIVFFVQKL